MERSKLFAINIRRLRDLVPLSQRGLAEAAKVSYGVVFRAESKNIVPRGENITKIANALGVDESELFADPNKEPKKPETPKQEIDPLEALSKALAAKGSIIIPLEEYEHLKANQFGSPEEAAVVKQINAYGDKFAFVKILRKLDLAIESIAVIFDLKKPKPKTTEPSQESLHQTPQQETDKPLTPKKSG